MDLSHRVSALIEPTLTDMGFDIVRVQLSGKTRLTLQVMAEPSAGGDMTVESCAAISRAISAILDVEDPITDQYTLEVSSPGLDRPLVRRRDFERFSGFEARIETSTPLDGRRRFTGRLGGLTDDRIQLSNDNETWNIPYDCVDRAKLLLTDELLAATEEQRTDD